MFSRKTKLRYKMLKNDLKTINVLIRETGEQWEGKHPIFCLIDNIMIHEGSKRILDLTSSIQTSSESTFQFRRYFMNFSNLEISSVIELDKETYPINFENEYVMTNVWARERLTRCLSYINSGKINHVNKTHEWKYDIGNHYTNFIFPMSISQTNNGNHSTFAGVIRRKGISYYTAIEDYSSAYDQCYFDGIYIVFSNKEKIKINYLEGLSFEIGRLLLENSFLFKGHPQENMLKDNALI